MTDSRPHAWYGQRLEAWRVGLLDEAQAQAMSTHVVSCNECRAIADEMALAAGSRRGEHVPASVLAAWPGVSSRLPALECELIENHLGRCTVCADALAIAVSVRAPAPAPVHALPSRRVFRLDGVRVWAVAATAAAALAVVWGASTWRRAAPVSPHAAPEPVITLQLTGEGTRLRDVLRGAGDPGPAVVTPGEREPAVVLVEPPLVPDTALVTIELVRANGAVLTRLVRRQSELFPDRRVLIGSEAAPVADGDYVLRFVTGSGAEADTQGYAFSVRRATRAPQSSVP